jgi:hypothetical protein
MRRTIAQADDAARVAMTLQASTLEARDSSGTPLFGHSGQTHALIPKAPVAEVATPTSELV